MQRGVRRMNRLADWRRDERIRLIWTDVPVRILRVEARDGGVGQREIQVGEDVDRPILTQEIAKKQLNGDPVPRRRVVAGRRRVVLEDENRQLFGRPRIREVSDALERREELGGSER